MRVSATAVLLPHDGDRVQLRAPKILMQGGYDKASFTSGTEQHSAGWKYFGTIAPKISRVAFRDMLKKLLTHAADEHEASLGTPTRPTFVLGPNERIFDCYSKDIQRTQASTSSPLVDTPKQPVLWDIFSGTGSVGSIFWENLDGRFTVLI